MLFEEKERTFQGSKSYIEGDWDYLDRSGRIEAQRVRTFLNYWVTQYPDSDRAELISRIKSEDSRNYNSATFELILFALLRSLGCSIIVHPDLANGNAAHPDFFVTTPNGESGYIEAVLASEYSEADISAHKRIDIVLNAIDKIDSPNFFLGIEAEGHPETPPNGKRLRTELERWVASLDPDDVAKKISGNGPDAMPRMKWEHEGWSIVFEVFPKVPEKRGKGQKVIGALSGGARFVNIWEPIREAVKAKGNRYGELAHPLIVAVNADSDSVDRIDEMQGLFGEEGYLFRVDDTSAPPEMRRRPNGAWFGPNGPQYTRVSGAWIFRALNPWSIVSRANTLYFNPWTVRPLPTLFTKLNHAKGEGGKMQWINGCSLGDLLKLSPGWPQ